MGLLKGEIEAYPFLKARKEPQCLVAKGFSISVLLTLGARKFFVVSSAAQENILSMRERDCRAHS